MAEIKKFDDPVLLVGGAPINVELLKRFSDMPTVAADAGAYKLSAIGKVPEMIVGDLDSIVNRANWEELCKVVHITEQDTIDFEKCLYCVDAPYFIAAGFLGARLDHTLAAMHVLQKFSSEKTVVLISDQDAVLVTRGNLQLTLPKQTRVSIYPLAPVTFGRSRGLAYPLEGLTLEAGVMIGTSNRVVDEEVSIQSDGDACFAVILPIDCVDALVDLCKRGV